MPLINFSFTPYMNPLTNSYRPMECFAGRVMAIENKSKDKEGLMLIMGKEKISRDSLHILAQQLPRILSNKRPFPTLFLHEKAKIEFESSIEYNQSHHQDSNECESTDKAVERAVLTAAKTQINLSMTNVKLDSFRKVYITGHGVSGLDLTSSGDSTFTAKEVVDFLEDNGILDSIKDLRFTCCGSADRRKIDSLSTESISIANRDSSFLEKLVFGESKSFIERVSGEIWDRGHTDVRVSGYHGAGVFYNGEHLPLTHLRSSTIPATDIVKRERVRVTLESDLD